MSNLLFSGFHRLWKNKVFWIGMIAMLVISVGTVLNGSRQAVTMMSGGYTRTLDDYYFELAPVVSLFCAVFASLFIGTEYSDGTMRNKIIVGRTRTEIYLSNYFICFVAGVCFVAVWLIGGLVGIPSLGLWKIGIEGALLYAVVAIFFTAALTGIFTLLCMLSSNKAITAVIAILLAIGLLVIASMIYISLGEPEFNSGVVVTSKGMQMAGPTPNHNYVSGLKRTIYQFVLECLPSGQEILMASHKIDCPILSLIASTVITFITTIAGVGAFCKKDLK